MTASAGSGAGPAVSHCEPSGVRDGVLSTHPQNESRLDLLSHVWEWLRHGVLKNVSRFCRARRGPSVPAFDTMLLTRTQQGHTATRVHACNLSCVYVCTFVRSTAACIELDAIGKLERGARSEYLRQPRNTNLY